LGIGSSKELLYILNIFTGEDVKTNVGQLPNLSSKLT